MRTLSLPLLVALAGCGPSEADATKAEDTNVVPEGDTDADSDADSDTDTDSDSDSDTDTDTDTDTAPDADEDGYSARVDCDEDDAAVHPGASESCNGIDDDCDGEIDPATSTDAGT